MIEDRCIEIAKDNRILLEKIVHIMKKDTRNINEHLSKEKKLLHESVRKQEYRRVKADNIKLLKRLQESNSRYNWESMKEHQRKYESILKSRMINLESQMSQRVGTRRGSPGLNHSSVISGKFANRNQSVVQHKREWIQYFNSYDEDNDGLLNIKLNKTELPERSKSVARSRPLPLELGNKKRSNNYYDSSHNNSIQNNSSLFPSKQQTLGVIEEPQYSSHTSSKEKQSTHRSEILIQNSTPVPIEGNPFANKPISVKEIP